MIFRDVFAHARQRSGLTLRAIASRAGLSAPGISKALDGNPTLRTMERLAEAVDCELRIAVVPTPRTMPTSASFTRFVPAVAYDLELDIAA